MNSNDEDQLLTSLLIDDDNEPPTTTFLSCNSASNAEEMTGMDGIEPVDLAYDYEIHMMEYDDDGDDADDLSSAVNDFEVGLLKAVGDEFGLITCRESVRRRSLRLAAAGGSSSSIVGVGSDPVDVEDSIHTECEVNVDFIESSKCTPMNGYMTAWVSKTDNRRRLSETDIYTAIETYTKNYATVEGGVLAISYIGTRPAATLDADESIAAVPFISSAIRENGTRDDLATNTNSKLSPGAIAGIVIASSVVVALLTMVALIIVKKRRNRMNTEEREMSIDDDNADDSLVTIDEDDEEQLSQFKEDMSKTVSHADDDSGDDDGDDDDTQDHSCDGTLSLNNTFESELVLNNTFETTEAAGGGGDQDDEVGFEVNI